jgi:hypothetical protein
MEFVIAAIITGLMAGSVAAGPAMNDGGIESCSSWLG